MRVLHQWSFIFGFKVTDPRIFKTDETVEAAKNSEESQNIPKYEVFLVFFCNRNKSQYGNRQNGLKCLLDASNTLKMGHPITKRKYLWWL